MSESWKNRLWQLVLVCTFAVVLSVYQKAVNSSSDGSGSSGTAFAYGSTVTISSLPNVFVSSAPLPTISHYLMCGNVGYPSDNSGTWYYYTCDATDSTELKTITISSGSRDYAISLADIHSAGFQPCSVNTSSLNQYVFHK